MKLFFGVDRTSRGELKVNRLINSFYTVHWSLCFELLVYTTGK